MCNLNGPIMHLGHISKLYFDGTISEKSPNGAFTCKSCVKRKMFSKHPSLIQNQTLKTDV